MPRGPEAKVQDATVKHARKRGCFACKIDSSITGVPDFLFIHPAFGAFFIEFKSPTGRLSAIQQVRHAEMVKAGAKVYVVRSARAGMALIDDLVDFGYTKYELSGVA